MSTESTIQTGCQWAVLHVTDRCDTSTADDHARAWIAAGVFPKRWKVGVEPFDVRKDIDWGLAEDRRGDDQGTAGWGKGGAIQPTVGKRGHAVGADRWEWRAHRRSVSMALIATI